VSGSMEALMRMVDLHGGLTVVPELATVGMDPERRGRLREFKPPVPVRGIGLATWRHALKGRLRQALREHALAGVAAHLHKARDPRVLPVSLASGAK